MSTNWDCDRNRKYENSAQKNLKSRKWKRNFKNSSKRWGGLLKFFKAGNYESQQMTAHDDYCKIY